MVETAALPNDAESLKALLVDVIAERDTAIAKNEEFSAEVMQLREYVRLMRSQRFGSSSERIHRDQLGLFNEAEQILDESAEPKDEARVCVPEYTRKTPSGLASPINRTNPGFVGGGRTAGGAREFVLPNGPIPKDALIRAVGQ